MYRQAKQPGLLVALLLIAACNKGQESDDPKPLPDPKGASQSGNKQDAGTQTVEILENQPAAKKIKGPKVQPVNPGTPGPRKGLTPDQLFPAKLDGFQRSTHDTKAALPELGLAFQGRHARYEKDRKQVDVFLYVVSDRDFEALRQPLYDRYSDKQTDTLESVFGGRVGSFWWNLNYRLKEGGEQGAFWCNKDWLLYVRSTDLENVGEFFDAYVAAVFIDGHVKNP